jgi:hypothetical protein
MVPLRKQFDWDTVKAFSEAMVRHLARTLPQLFVAKSGPKNRVGKIFVDSSVERPLMAASRPFRPVESTTQSGLSSERLETALCFRCYGTDRTSENDNEDSHCIRPRWI